MLRKDMEPYRSNVDDFRAKLEVNRKNFRLVTVEPPKTAYFCESSGLSNCALPWAVLRRRKLGAADSSASDIEMSSSFAESREFIFREE